MEGRRQGGQAAAGPAGTIKQFQKQLLKNWRRQ
jgi:hypothetical protein